MVNGGSERIEFRPIDIDRDVDSLLTWLSDDDVRRWYDEGEHALANYRQRFSPEETTHKFIFSIDGTAAGYLQAYRLADEPDYARQIELDPETVSIDMFIGDSSYRNRGWGCLVLRAALDRIVFGEMHANQACINPDPENIRAVKCYERAGFRGDRVVFVRDDEPGNTGNERIMVLTRNNFFGDGS